MGDRFDYSLSFDPEVEIEFNREWQLQTLAFHLLDSGIPERLDIGGQAGGSRLCADETF